MVNTFLRRAREEHGFTLIEMLVVVLILGVLSSIAVIGVASARRTSAVQACSTDWQTFDTAIKSYGVDHLSPTTGLPDYSGLATNALTVLSTGTTKYLSSAAISDPTKYRLTVSASGSTYSIQVSNTAGGAVTTLTDTATASMASTACSTAVPS